MLRAIIGKGRSYSASSTPKQFSFDLPIDSYETFKLPDASQPSQTAVATKETLLSLYRTMVQIRRLETASDSLYKAKLIRGFCHLSTGQEALAAGMEAGIERDDAIITAYRCHGFTLTRGASPVSILGELMGRDIGVSKGKGGSYVADLNLILVCTCLRTSFMEETGL
jgi:pyruvate dehydrogenase E1 component alpha subunit